MIVVEVVIVIAVPLVVVVEVVVVTGQTLSIVCCSAFSLTRFT